MKIHVGNGIAIEPYQNNGQPGYLCMPLVRNIPEGKVGWKKVKCQICGSECWERPEQKQLLKENNNMIACCTKCAIEKVTIRDGVTIRGG